MCERILEGRKRKPKNEEDEDMGFGDFGGYFEAKKSKLVEQYKLKAANTEVKSTIFKGIAIFVNGLTNPNASELKQLMAEHGGIYHGYQMSSTTHIIASNLAYAKTKNLGSCPIVKASWITDSTELKKLLDYKRYLLFSNQSAAQPSLKFPALSELENCENKGEKTETVMNQDSSRFNISPTKNGSIETSSTDKEKSRISKTASDPQFLEEFYNNSRLHLIATMGAEFKQLVGRLREKSDGNFPGKEMLLLKGNSSNKRTYSSVVMHIDMDCFFVSVGLRNKPELKGKPVAVTHARNGQISSVRPGRSAEIAMNIERAPVNIVEKISNLDSHSSMSEIACCSYEARKCGIKNGMFLGTAVKLCPSLKTIPYDFQGYKEVASTLYETVATYTLDIEAVSCDEMYVEVTKLLNESGLSVDQFASHLRSEIMEKTGCPCSTGFGANKLQARLATKKAKPNGQFYLEVDDAEAYFSELHLGELPGVGRATLSKLKNLGLSTCGDVQMASLSVLQREFGQKVGETLLEQSKGIDRKPLNFHHERKSVSAEINYGIRFKTLAESHNFLHSLSQEVFNRLNDIGMKGKCLTLKLMVRAADAPVETAKFLGHGICDSLSKSTSSNVPIADVKTIFKEAKQLYDKFNVPFEDLRGMGIQLSKLEKNGPASSVMSNFLKLNFTKMENDGTTENADLLENSERRLPIPQENAKEKPQTVRNIAKEHFTETSNGRKEKSNKTSSTMKEAKSKRGRTTVSRSKHNSKSKASPSPMLDRYFRNMGTPVKMANASTFPNIDLDVLNELPEDIRNEIIKEYKLHRPKKIEEKKENIKIEATKVQVKKSVPAKKSPFDGLTWEELKRALKAWITSESEPGRIDIEMISEHFRRLAIDRKIEYLKVAFNFLYRNLAKLSCKWHEAYFSMVNTAQQGMVARYGGTLMVERKFSCSK